MERSGKERTRIGGGEKLGQWKRAGSGGEEDEVGALRKAKDIQLDTLDLERNRNSAIPATASHDYGGGNSMPRGTSASPSRQIAPYIYS
ncbi:hypothetical protein FCM35_KLT13281 [Carex littledalei]|uniref:Uncharacterized protein n=1 Tax=Carex littledalei TaxID=544730 RepID=A0A833VE00_9POAL|nr:hypothetical protein FCM35_KLT13281 [Carex littledalei]